MVGRSKEISREICRTIRRGWDVPLIGGVLGRSKMTGPGPGAEVVAPRKRTRRLRYEPSEAGRQKSESS